MVFLSQPSNRLLTESFCNLKLAPRWLPRQAYASNPAAKGRDM